MGDRSPKSKQKDKQQKQSKTDAANVAKQKIIDSKKTVSPPSSKKKK
jgi:hypothetical protein